MTQELPDCLMNLARDPDRLQVGLEYVSGGWSGMCPASTVGTFEWLFANDGKKYVIDRITFAWDCRGPTDSWVTYYPDSTLPTNYIISDKYAEFGIMHSLVRRNAAVFEYPGKLVGNVSNSNFVARWMACVFNYYTFVLP